MADFVLKTNQNVTLSVGAADITGTPVAVVFDANSVVATVSDPGALVAVVSADETTVNVKALGPLTTGDTVTVSGSVAGVALTPATFIVDVEALPAVAVTLTPGVVATN